MSFGWRKYSLNTGEDVEANVVDGLVFDVKVNLGIDIDFDADFDVIEVMGDFEDDIVSLFVFFVNRQKWVTFKFEDTREKYNLQTNSLNISILLD